MKEIPIIMSTPMVEVILEGRKTETRRILKSSKLDVFAGTELKFGFTAFTPDRHISVRGNWIEKVSENKTRKRFGESFIKCPYGKVGDILWVREAFATFLMPKGTCAFRAGQVLQGPGLWKPSIHMNKEYARIWLKAEYVLVEKLQQITSADAVNEGIEKENGGWKDYSIIHAGRHKGTKHPHAAVPFKSPIDSYKSLWESINGPDSWNANPWVWVIGFKVLSTNGRPTLIFPDFNPATYEAVAKIQAREL